MTAILGGGKGQLLTCRKNEDSVLGHGKEFSNLTTTPTIVKGLLSNKTVDGLAIGAGFMVCSTKENLTYSWGDGFWGAFGHQNTEHCHEPTCIVGLMGQYIKKIACGSNHTVVLTKEYNKNHVFVFGCNTDGQLGIKTEDSIMSTPTRLICPGILDVSCGYENSFFLGKSDILGCGKFVDQDQVDRKVLVVPKPRIIITFKPETIYEITAAASKQLYALGVRSIKSDEVQDHAHIHDFNGLEEKCAYFTSEISTKLLLPMKHLPMLT